MVGSLSLFTTCGCTVAATDGTNAPQARRRARPPQTSRSTVASTTISGFKGGEDHWNQGSGSANGEGPGTLTFGGYTSNMSGIYSASSTPIAPCRLSRTSGSLT